MMLGLGRQLVIRSSAVATRRFKLTRLVSSSSTASGPVDNQHHAGDIIANNPEPQEVQKNQPDQPFTELVRHFVNPQDFYGVLARNGFDFFCGVPDSLLKDFCSYVEENVPADRHVITANEGNAIALASGYHLATGKAAVVYLQNSGLGNCVNPLMSLATPSVYSIPMLLLVGWRGEPGKLDEPQHQVQGSCTPLLLDSLGIPYQTLPDYIEGAEKAVLAARDYVNTVGGPWVLLVRRQCFYKFKSKYVQNTHPLTREEVCENIVASLSPSDVVVSTTGMLSRELFEYRARNKQGHHRDFLTVGSMGHASSIAMGIAMGKPNRQIYCLDGDGACLMHMGTMGVAGTTGLENFRHILVNNGAHDSVGGQPTAGTNWDRLSFGQIARGCGYKTILDPVSSAEEIKAAVHKLRSVPAPAFLEIRCKKGNRIDLGRPTRTPQENKLDFMHFLRSE
ncbi:phosphonopyruvate decarboxylase-like [Sycon ciliatum]|uniref:phosphonopyruvate decarboxylase-like n=1 Tax=Sycon ciliatum TaxID=27933 RepID=UPI0020AA82ED|eukprot:scpid72894/ scgid32505/ Phosphonopyruvate decarboxylase